MRRDTRPAGRAGFTLIELLIVVAILALLAALVAAGIGKVKDAQQSRVTKQTVLKLQKAVDNQWKVICDKCNDDRRGYKPGDTSTDFGKLVGFCDGDVDRADALWMHMNLRRYMPQTFKEATTAVACGGVTLQPMGPFRAIKVDTSAEDGYAESAALLYLILTQGAKGVGFPIDDVMNGAQTTVTVRGQSLSAFRDAQGTPIAFRRFYQHDELDQPPFAKPGQGNTDTLDRFGKLANWAKTIPTSAAKQKNAATAVFGDSPGSPAPGRSASGFDGKNKMAVVMAAGADALDLPENAKSPAFDGSAAANGEATTVEDNIYGFQLTRLGN